MTTPNPLHGTEPSWQSRIDPDRYLKEFPQEVPVLKDRWSSEILEDGARLIGLPNHVTVRLSAEASDLGLEEPEEFQTSMLWKHSLAILPAMAGAGDIAGVEIILGGYAPFLTSARWAELSSRMTSLDHCVATRIRAICALRAVYYLLGRPLPRSAYTILEHDLVWAGEPEHYAPNNHGIMLGISTMHASEVFPDTTPPSVSEVGAAQFERIIADAFDDDWVCVENTPEYQGFYLTLCTNVLKFLDISVQADGVLSARLHSLVDGATKSLSKMLLPSGRYPALGDSGTPWTPPIQNEDGVTYSPATGLYIQKRDGVYFSFKCGYSSYVHKHMDDTSITLTVDDEDLIIDAGLHNYDWHDPITRSVKSQRGHSGFFFPEFDHLYPSTMYRPEKYRIRSRLQLLESNSNLTTLSGRSIVDGTHRVARVVRHAPGMVEITDRYWVDSKITDSSIPVQRFLIPLSLTEVSTPPGTLRFLGKASWIELKFEPGRDVDVSTGTQGELPRGWMSRGWSSSEACRAIDISVGGNFATDVTVSYGRLSEAGSVRLEDPQHSHHKLPNVGTVRGRDVSSNDHNGATV